MLDFVLVLFPIFCLRLLVYFPVDTLSCFLTQTGTLSVGTFCRHSFRSDCVGTLSCWYSFLISNSACWYSFCWHSFCWYSFLFSNSDCWYSFCWYSFCWYSFCWHSFLFDRLYWYSFLLALFLFWSFPSPLYFHLISSYLYPSSTVFTWIVK